MAHAALDIANGVLQCEKRVVLGGQGGHCPSDMPEQVSDVIGSLRLLLIHCFVKQLIMEFHVEPYTVPVPEGEMREVFVKIIFALPDGHELSGSFSASLGFIVSACSPAGG